MEHSNLYCHLEGDNILKIETTKAVVKQKEQLLLLGVLGTDQTLVISSGHHPSASFPTGHLLLTD